MNRTFLAVIGLAAGVATFAAPAMADAATLPPGHASASTQLTNRPDSGAQGNNWASDNFKRVASVTRGAKVSAADCGLVTGNCYFYHFTLTDKGTFTTIPGQQAPRTGVLDLAVTGSMAGGTSDGAFYASSAEPQGWRVESSEDDSVSVTQSTGTWVEQFFAPGTSFGTVDLGDWGWTYRLNFGGDASCPNDAYQWVDASVTGGTTGFDGNILAPNSADCS